MSEKILRLNSPAADLETAGGKGANLSALIRAQFPVPPGFIITSQAYRDFVNESGIQPVILTLVEGIAPEKTELVEKVSRQIQAMFAQSPMQEDTARQILQAYQDLSVDAIRAADTSDQPAADREPGRSGRVSSAEGLYAVDSKPGVHPALSFPVAVRSSANVEDLPGFAFAGQQDTFLNIIGGEALLDAVKRCWSSLWTARAISYRARGGFSPERVALAVVVQALVPADVSGVLFTADPLTGRRGEIHIDASYGLGEAIVSGLVEPDHYIVDPQTWRITSRRLGTKQVTIRPRSGGGTERSDGALASGQALTDGPVIALAKMGQHAADFFKEPQDIEWAWGDGRLFLLQSRPITSLYPLPSPELDGGMPRVYFNFNAIQGVPDPLTPLGMNALQLLFGSVSHKMGVRLPADQVMPQAGNRLFLDFGSLPGDPILGKFVFGLLDSTEPGERDILQRLIAEGRIPTRRIFTPRIGMQMLGFFGPALAATLRGLIQYQSARERVIRSGEAYLASVQASLAVSSAEAAGRKGEAVTDLASCKQMLAACLRSLEENLPRAGEISLGAMPLAMIASNLVLALDGWLVRWLGEPAGTALPLLRSLPGNVTVLMNLRLWAAAQAIREDSAALAAVSNAPAEQLVEQYRQGRLPPAAQQAVEKFLRSDGMRGVAEIDLGKPRWNEDPSPVIHTLQGYLRQTDPDQAPDVIYRQGAEQAETLLAGWTARIRKTHWGWLHVRLFMALARRARALASLREIPLYYLARVLALYRQALLIIGERLAGFGVIDYPDDLFFVPLEILKKWAQADNSDASSGIDLRNVIEAQRSIYARELLRKQMPRVLLSTGEAFYEAPAQEESPETSGTSNQLIGTPVSPGIASGPARVILDPHGARLEPGEILVCPSTDPGWTPLFLTAAGLVMEIGGLMTHGSVVAREYGIPAVVGVPGATARIQTGQMIEVDGNTGRVRIL